MEKSHKHQKKARIRPQPAHDTDIEQHQDIKINYHFGRLLHVFNCLICIMMKHHNQYAPP